MTQEPTLQYEYQPPTHPRNWKNCHARPTAMQLAWLTRLISMMGVPRTVMRQTLDSLTLGQASLLIGRLREAQERLCTRRGAMVMLENAVKYVQAELPAPKGRTTWRPR